MRGNIRFTAVLIVVAVVITLTRAAAESSLLALTPATMPRVGTVSDRYQAYNVEMLEVTGGKFWRPYGPALETALRQPAAPSSAAGDTPAGMNPALYEYRPPINLRQPRLRKLAAALAPAYMRVSGTWANTTWLADTDPAPSKPPPGFSGVLTRQQWKAVVDFSRAVDAPIVTSFATSPGTRDRAGVWTPEQAHRFVAYTESLGGRIAAAEFMNEPTFAAMGGAPAGYDAAAYGRDFQVFRAFARETTPGMLILGPGSVGETTGEHGVAYGSIGMLPTRDLLTASGPGVDAFSYHHYGAVSQRCVAQGNQTTAAAALSEEWLARTDETLAFYRKLRDEFEPGKPIWLTETADAACGGNPWANTFLDTFRYVDQLGRLAKQQVEVVMHNTLIASDYGLLDDRTLAPKPNYWAALVWRKLMGTTVLDAGVPMSAGLRVYAHCERGTHGGVALLVVNTDRDASRSMRLPMASERYTLAAVANDLQTNDIKLNDKKLELGAHDELPLLVGVSERAGTIRFAPATITFLAVSSAGNGACR